VPSLVTAKRALGKAIVVGVLNQHNVLQELTLALVIIQQLVNIGISPIVLRIATLYQIVVLVWQVKLDADGVLELQHFGLYGLKELVSVY